MIAGLHIRGMLFAAGLFLPLSVEAQMTETSPFSTVLSAWNEPDETVRRALIDDALSVDFTYDDVHRNAPLTSRVAFEDFLTQFRANVSGITVRLDGPPEVLRGTARFRFIMERDGAPFSRGTYFATLDEDGKINRMIGFMDQEPSR
ncbi:hypothetical protein [Roseobacter weihaiensis]|uniref:hypothetical protein n=1 Tax=Roseobacter weihaiensis TaxID=2763262 RepID=UPI001D0B030E|nr:hypothetical protein [Roseobacter sp. H9]